MLEREQDIRSVEQNGFFLESANLLQIEEEFAPRAVFHDVIQVLLRLECVFQLYDEWMINILEDIAFNNGILNLTQFTQLLLFEDFHGEDLFMVSLGLNEGYFAVRSLADDRYKIEIIPA